MDANLLLAMLLVFVTVTLVLLIRVEWRDWGLVGLLFLCAGVSAVLTRANFARWGVEDGANELLWLWRAGALIGGVIVLTGLGIEFYRRTPPWGRIIGRLALGALGAGVIIGAMRLWYWAV